MLNDNETIVLRVGMIAQRVSAPNTLFIFVLGNTTRISSGVVICDIPVRRISTGAELQ
jgi:hypothetical protein